MIAYGPGLRDWLDKQLECETAKDAQYLGRLNEHGEPIAACAFSNYTGEDIELSVAALPGSATRELVDAIFRYVFIVSGCERCTVRIREDNYSSIKLARRLGFKYEGRQRKAKNGKDLYLFGLLKDEYGFLTKTPKARRPDHGHQRPGASEPDQPDYAIRQPDLRA